VSSASGQADEVARVMRRDRQRQRLRIGEPDVLAREDDEAPRDEPRVFPPASIFASQYIAASRSLPRPAFDETRKWCRSARPRRRRNGCRRSRAKTSSSAAVSTAPSGSEHEHFERIKRAAEIAVAEHREIGEELVVGRHAARAEPAFCVGQRRAQHAGDLRGRERLESKR